MTFVSELVPNEDVFVRPMEDVIEPGVPILAHGGLAFARGCLSGCGLGADVPIVGRLGVLKKLRLGSRLGD